MRHGSSAAQAGLLDRVEPWGSAALPAEVQDVVGYALFLAQGGGRHPAAKRLKGEWRGLVEVVEDHESGTYRAVYTAKLAGAIYVLHVFQKKAPRGIATPKHEVELIRARLRRAEEHARRTAGGGR